MSDVITPVQVRGARAMLNWSLVKLAFAARLSVSALKRIEDGVTPKTSAPALIALQDVLEDKGVSFLPDDGNGLGIRMKVS